MYPGDLDSVSLVQKQTNSNGNLTKKLYMRLELSQNMEENSKTLYRKIPEKMSTCQKKKGTVTTLVVYLLYDKTIVIDTVV